MEDYTLRFAPRSYRKWSTRVVGISALGGIAYLADFAIGANIGMAYGTTNALWGILIFAVVIMATGFPLAYYAARYNIDLDLITRGSGFGYYGSVVTNIIFATFTFIFFALEGSIMAQGLKLGLGLPLWLGYAVSTLIIFPLVIYGMKVLSTLQVWTTPLWLVLMVAPFGYLLISHPESIHDFFAYQGANGIKGFDHRQFLNRYYVNRFPGSFARGVPFQDNPATGDCRISGTCASLAGLEQGDPHAVARILLLHSVALSTGGIPLIYLGDEVGTLNHAGYLSDPAKAGDSRWVHRPPRDAARHAQRHAPDSDAGRIFAGLQRLIAARRGCEAFAGGQLVGFRSGNASVLGYSRASAASRVLVLANFSEFDQPCPAEVFSAMPDSATDLITGGPRALRDGLVLAPYKVLWLAYGPAPQPHLPD